MGKGGFTWSEVYNLPIHLRRFYINKLIEFAKKEAENSKSSGSTSMPSKPNMSRSSAGRRPGR